MRRVICEINGEPGECPPGYNIADYYHSDGTHTGPDEDGVSLRYDDYTLMDGGGVKEYADTLEEAAEIAADWFGHLADDGWEIPDPDLDASSLDALNKSISAWIGAIAEANGYESFSGHGRYHVSAASRAGISLDVEEAE